ncbi:MAG: glycosyltransferase family 2 protein [Chthoniobacter sp.]|nr:glycosyltransferase family 2 protein [Chthoniobacter sp.]
MATPPFTAGTLAATLVFWLSIVALAYTFVGYSVLMALLARGRKIIRHSLPEPAPEVCVVLVAHNEESRIVARLTNLLDSTYPLGRLRILLVDDASTDATVARARAFDPARVTILPQSMRAGKAAGLNAALAQETAEIIVLTDARQRFASNAIALLAAHFGDQRIGAVSGSLEIETSISATGTGIDTYWRMEKSLRAAEARFDSCIGCTGAIYAIRRTLFTPIPTDTLLDDVVIPMHIAATGARVIHDSEALAFDPQTLDPTSEQRRKQRTLAGNFQMLVRYPKWLLPWQHRLWWQLLSHKYLRLAAPLFLFPALAANFALVARPFYQATLAVQVLFYTAAVLGFLPGWRRLGVLAWPAGFVFLNAMTLRGFHHYLTRRDGIGWK